LKKIEVPEKSQQGLFGPQDDNLRYLEGRFDVEIAARGREITIRGEPGRVEVVADLLLQLASFVGKGHAITEHDLAYAARVSEENGGGGIGKVLPTQVRPSPKKVVSPRTPNQALYLEAIRRHDIVFGIGPAGTGKTYLAVAMALAALLEKQVERIVLARPAVEAGERLGFLPGDMAQKVEPYLRPLYDAIFDLQMKDEADRLLERGIIEVAPLAFMRGRSLNDSFVILDEAQNTTSEQMKMFLTRIGFRSRAVITGDITQIDLPAGKISGLVESRSVVSSVEGISFVYFDDRDVVRHPLVQKIIVAYESYVNGGEAASDSAASHRTEPERAGGTRPGSGREPGRS
jgi:phosphate starvation-inducible PhoH-like protein